MKDLDFICCVNNCISLSSSFFAELKSRESSNWIYIVGGIGGLVFGVIALTIALLITCCIIRAKRRKLKFKLTINNSYIPTKDMSEIPVYATPNEQNVLEESGYCEVDITNSNGFFYTQDTTPPRSTEVSTAFSGPKHGIVTYRNPTYATRNKKLKIAVKDTQQITPNSNPAYGIRIQRNAPTTDSQDSYIHNSNPAYGICTPIS